MTKDRHQHWEHVYETKTPEQVSWTQKVPRTSLDFINATQLPKNASIIDIGGGDSNLVDFLLEEGYTNITVLDISGKALERAKERLGEKAKIVQWIVSDITHFKPTMQYDIWHDRAVFHFLTKPEEIEAYVSLANNHVNSNMVIGTFSESGPLKCSGLEITQYSEASMSSRFQEKFDRIKCLEETHKTPFNTTQNFVFCSFKRK
ncbi:class I SAM-dependent methyltransferase [Flavobacteriaceae bacterium S356]|uniref:Class I SAM-dependent methyltransferase n=1 Tax=Asprobacillus argus TaxID=3076534 RepID=A0ABU3LGY9_9FLAO|nr:class I SAM-dependent methyltransferase [Flavobacteriaceae bacterium S356]